MRHYGPETGRYLTLDPIAINKGRNHLYLYTSNDPITRFDFSGLAEACFRRWDFGPLGYAFPVKHCYLSFSNGSTLSFDPKGVHSDSTPNTWFKVCYPLKQNSKCQCNEDCLREMMYRQDYTNLPYHGYRFLDYNCCDGIRIAIKACGCDMPWGIDWVNVGY